MRVLSLLLILPAVIGHSIRALSIYGLETEREDFVCTWANPITVYLDKVTELGFNAIRVPFSKQWVDKGDFTILDNFMWESHLRNLSIILDYHRTYNTHQGDDVYEGGVTLEQYIGTWMKLLDRYNWYPNLEGHNALNEPKISDPGPIRYWTRALFDAVEAKYPDRFYHFVTGPNWSSSLRGMLMEDLPYHDRIMYSLHIYPFSGASTRKQWEWNMAEIPVEKLIIGEWSWQDGKERWAYDFVAFLKEKGIQHTCFWTLSASHDTCNLYDDSCWNINWDHYNILKTAWV